MHGGTNQSGHRTLHHTDSPEKLERRQEGEDNEREPETPPPPSVHSTTLKEIVHATDVTLTLSNDIQDKGFLRIMTKVKVCEYA